MEKYNILYIISSSNIYGNENDLLRLLEGSDRKRFNNFIICTGEGPLAQYLKARGEKVAVIHQRNSFNLLAKIRLFKFIRKNDIHLIHSHFSRLDGIVAKLAGVPFVQKRNFPPAKTFSISRLPLIDKILDIFVDKIITVSDSLRQQAIQRGIRADKIRTIYYGIDPSTYKNCLIDKRRYCEELGINSDSPIIGTVGRLEKQKGHRYLLEAMPEIIKEFPDAQFLIAGEGSLSGELIRLAGRLGAERNIKFLGYRKDISGILQILDIFVLPSLWEGLPFAALEAMAAARPVVATNVDGIPEALLDGETGIFVPPCDRKKLAEGILYLLRDGTLREKMGRAGQRRAEDIFRPESMCGKTEELYSELLKRQKANLFKLRIRQFALNSLRKILNLTVDAKYAAAVIFGTKTTISEPLKEIKKILLINLSGIGDVIRTTPAIRAIKESHPHLHLTMLCDKHAAETLIGNPYIDRIIHYDDKSWRDFLGALKNIRSEKFDLSVLFFGRVKGCLLTLLSGAKNHAGFLNNNLYEIKKFGRLLEAARIIVDKSEPLTRRHQRIAELLGSRILNNNLEIFLNAEEYEYADSLLNNFGVEEDKFVICLNPEAGWNCRKWPFEKFAELGDRIYEIYGAKIIISGSADSVKTAQKIALLMKNEPIVLAGRTTIRQLAAVLKKCSLLITVDSAPLHIAQAVGTPTITLFGPTDYRVVFSQNDKNLAIWKSLSCSPCYNGLHQPLCNNFRCMEAITVDEVLQIVDAGIINVGMVV